MGFDYLACAQAEAAYKAFVSVIDQIVEFPLAILKFLRNTIKMLESTAYKNIEDFFENLLDLFDKFLEFPDSPDDLTDDFCESLLNCEFLYKSMLPASTDGTYYDLITQEYVSGYEWFRRNICTHGLGAYIDELKAMARDNINSIIDSIEGTIGKGFKYINGIIDDLTAEYTEFLNKPITDYFPFFDTLWRNIFIFNWVEKSEFDPKTASILDVINLLNLFGKCVFSVCDLSVSVKNKIADIESKLSVSIESKQYVPNAAQIKMRTKEKEMAAKITTINAAT